MQADTPPARNARRRRLGRLRSGWQFDWKPIFVGFAAGLIVAVLGALQWMEWRRRRTRRDRSRPNPRSQPSMTPEPSEADAPPSDRVEGAP